MNSSNKSNMNKFDADLRKFADSVNADFMKLIKKIVFDLFRKIVMKTPVDTGRARASWAVAKHSPGDFVHPEFKSTIGKGTATTMAMGNLPNIDDPYATYFIFNNVPYIVRLENGHSKQAPVGMVQVALAEMEAELFRLSP